MKLPNLGEKYTSEEAANFFEVAESTVLRHPARYGGVKLGRRILFFENLIGEAIRRHYAVTSKRRMGRPFGWRK